MDERPVIDLARLYRETRLRVMNLVAGLTDPELDIRTPACPAWTVRDIVAHLTAIPEDAASGRLKGIPTDEFTAGQVARLGGLPVAEVLARWAAAAADFEAAIAAHEVWPAVIDVASHEQDIRGRSAIQVPGTAQPCAPAHRYCLTGSRFPCRYGSAPRMANTWRDPVPPRSVS
ncbi:MAG TPA: maleylpyruvate isomerase N-terminal domain-containing protein [Streptosporangiaceae bacterium]|nr:maleylpyruvate isomerase N-terminal domain-containing protein [Streptosporangiaceae bacterium]